jgi:hypothetical protein
MGFIRKKSYFNSSLYATPKAPPKVQPKVEEVLPKGTHLIRRNTTEKGAERLTDCDFGLRLEITDNQNHATLDTGTMMVALLMDIRARLDQLIRNTEPVIVTTNNDLIEAAQEVFYTPTKEYWAGIDKRIKELTAP